MRVEGLPVQYGHAEPQAKVLGQRTFEDYPKVDRLTWPRRLIPPLSVLASQL